MRCGSRGRRVAGDLPCALWGLFLFAAAATTDERPAPCKPCPYEASGESLLQLRGQQAPCCVEFPENDQIGEQYVGDAQDYAWRVQGEASEARAHSHEIHARDTMKRTQAAAGRAKAAKEAQAGFHKNVESERDGAIAASKEAKAWEAKTQGVLDATYDKAFDAAKAAAETKVADLEAAAAAYYQELLAALAAKANPPGDPMAAAAAAAAAPYIDVAKKTKKVVAKYNKFVKDLIAGAKGCVKLAFKMANGANEDQAFGNWEMAMRKMIFAHSLIGKANKLEGKAKKVYKLAREINVAVPSLFSSAEEAALNVVNTWPGNNQYGTFLELGAGGAERKAKGARRQNPFGQGTGSSAPKTPMRVPSAAEVKGVTSELLGVDQSLTALDSDLASLDQRLGELQKQALLNTDTIYNAAQKKLALSENTLSSLDRQFAQEG